VINVYWTTGTVGTCLIHLRQGKTQLFRRNADIAVLREIFRNPRVHTGSGYHRVLQLQQQQHQDEDHHSNNNKRRRIDTNGHTTTTASSSFTPGDRVYVTGHAEATVRSGVLPQGTSNYPGRIKVEYDDGKTFHVTPNQLVPAVSVQDEEAEVLKEMQRLASALQDIDYEREQLKQAANEIKAEKSKLTEILNSFKEKRRKQAEQEAAKKARRAKIAAKKKAEEKRTARETSARFRRCESRFLTRL
jgi:hypothetical protein